MVTPELFEDLNEVKLNSPNTLNPDILKQPRNSDLHTTILGVEVQVMDYDEWTKYDCIKQEKLKLEVKTALYEAEEAFNKHQKHYNTIIKQLEEWKWQYIL